MNVAEPAQDVSRAEHPLSLRLSRIMELGAQDLSLLDRVIQKEQLVKKRKDLVVGNEFRNLCFVRDGYAIRYRLLRNGKRQILNVILPGDVIGLPVSFFDRSIGRRGERPHLQYLLARGLRAALLRAASVWSGVELACRLRGCDLC
jgi:CRP-like cAMP-binding protein